MFRKKVMIEKRIRPKYMRYRGGYHKIVRSDKSLVVKSYCVITELDKIMKVVVRGKHPNVHPETNEFCLPHKMVGADFNEINKAMIEHMLSSYNLENCYFMPWPEVEEYRRIA